MIKERGVVAETRLKAGLSDLFLGSKVIQSRLYEHLALTLEKVEFSTKTIIDFALSDQKIPFRFNF